MIVEGKLKFVCSYYGPYKNLKWRVFKMVATDNSEIGLNGSTTLSVGWAKPNGFLSIESNQDIAKRQLDILPLEGN